MLRRSIQPKPSTARPIDAVRLVVLLLLAAFARQGATQSPEPTPEGSAPKTVVSTSRSAPEGRVCSSAETRATRTGAHCEPTKVVVGVETETTFSIELPATKTARCAVTIDVGYTQRGAIVRVEGTIENKDCAASSGDYKVAVSVRDESRELKTLDFFDSWQRNDDQSVAFKGDYPIGENVDVVRVRTSQLRCTCADTPAQ